MKICSEEPKHKEISKTRSIMTGRRASAEERQILLYTDSVQKILNWRIIMKKILSFLMGTILLISFVGCGQKESPTVTTSQPASVSAQMTETKPETVSVIDAAADYPGSDLRIIVPFATGGALDVQARTIAKFLAKELNCNVIVENIAGAGGQMGTTSYLVEKPNTTSILLTDSANIILTPQLNTVEYLRDDFEPIIDHNTLTFALFSNPSKSGINSYDDLVAFSEQSTVKYGSGGPGTALYIAQNTLFSLMGAKSATITQDSAIEGLSNLLAGTVDVTMSAIDNGKEYVMNGDMECILYFGDEDYPADDIFPNGIPCAKSVGIDMNYGGFYYYSIRKGTNQAIIDKLQLAFQRVYENPEFQVGRDKIVFSPSGMTPQEINEFLDEYERMAKQAYVFE